MEGGGLGISVSTLLNTSSTNGNRSDGEEKAKMLPLHRAIVENDVASVQLLCSAPDMHNMVNAVDENGNTALHFAADRGRVDMIGILLEKGADRTARDVDGNTPLMLAELCDHTEAVELLRAKEFGGDEEKKRSSC